MRCVLVCTVVLAGCLDFSIEPGTLGCDRAVSPACPNDWVCVASAGGGAGGLCYPRGTDAAQPDGGVPPDGDGGSLPDGDGGAPPPQDPLAVGPEAAPSVAPSGRRFHVDPTKGDIGNPGTEQAPWSTLAEVLAAQKIEQRDQSGAVKSAGEVKAGDALILYDGDHGELDLSGYFNSERIYVVAAANHRPRATRIVLQTGRNWWIQGLTVTGPCGSHGELVRLLEPSGVDFVGNTVTVAADPSGWSAADWKSSTCGGITVLRGAAVRLAFNEVRTTVNGIFLSNTSGNTVERNRIDGFTDKGMMISGGETRDLTIRGNLVQNGFDVGRSPSLMHFNTCPGCQRIEVTGNRLFGSVGQRVPEQFRQAMQGLVMFDGLYSEVSIINNVVVGDHWHGISVIDGTEVSIVNNTTVGGYDAPAGEPDHSFIKVSSSAPATVTVRNNLTNLIDVPGGATADHNGIVDQPDAYFVDWRVSDYRLREASPAVDQGSLEGAPADDLAGRSRDGKPDQGAFERVSGD